MRLIYLAFLAIALFLWGMTARSEEPGYLDVLEIRNDETGVHIFYSNSGDMNSENIARRMTLGEISVLVQVEVNGGERGAERITVMPDPPYMAWPADPQDVPDGNSVRIRIIPPFT